MGHTAHPIVNVRRQPLDLSSAHLNAEKPLFIYVALRIFVDLPN